jgi:hypothetical protein
MKSGIKGKPFSIVEPVVQNFRKGTSEGYSGRPEKIIDHRSYHFYLKAAGQMLISLEPIAKPARCV